MKKLILIFLLCSCGGLAFVYYYWQQATQIPEWYKTQSPLTQQKLDGNSSSELMAAQARLREKVKTSIAKSQAIAADNTLVLGSRSKAQSESLSEFNSDSHQQEPSTSKSVELELNNQEVNTLVMTTVAQDLRLNSVLASTPGLNTTIKDGILEIGTVINLENLSKNQLAEREIAALDKVVTTLPFLEKQKLYVAISGQPKIENGKVKLDETTKIKLGNLSLSIPELAQRLGISQEEIERNLHLSLKLENLKVNELEITDDKALIKGLVD
ncbi:MAG: hypothetical protein AB1589_17675 [Cyanobacteriota bacterium]